MATVKAVCPKCKVLLSVNRQNDSQQVKCPKCGYSDTVVNFPPPERRQIQCPQCRTVLSMYANATGMVKCPKCQHCDDAANYLSPQNSTPVSDSEFETGLHTRPAGKSEQMLKPGILALIKGEYECSPDTVRLQRGVNTLGRSASSSHASIQLNTNDGYMSRMHASIDLIMKSDGTFVHNLADAGSNNGTWHNGEKLEKGDQILLKPGDVIKIGHTAFEFKLEE